MKGSPIVTTLVGLVTLGACKGSSRGAPTVAVEAGSAMGDAATGLSSEPLAIFSAPIAGAEVGGGEAIAVGLEASAHALVAARVDASGRARWRQTILTGVDWSADAELHAWSIDPGAAITWRGLKDGHTVHVAAVISPTGLLVQPPSPIGSLVCATDDGFAWTTGEKDAGGAGQLVVRSWAAASPQDVKAAISDDVTLECGAHRAYAIADGDDAEDGTPTRVFAAGGGGAGPVLTFPPGAMGKDEERDLFAWATGDAFGLVRLSNGGALNAVEVKGDQPSPLRTDRARVAPEDDVVAVDADSRGVTLVTTHDDSDACPGGGAASSVNAIRIPRVGPGAATTRKLAPFTCGADVGPFWSDDLHGANVVGWVERASRASKGRALAPITGFSWRVFDDAGRAGRVAVLADALVDAGCDDASCFVVALVRPEGEDGMKPETIRVRAYP